MNKIFMFLFCILIGSTAQATISDKKTIVDEGVLIDGVADFLKERAEANMIYMFERKIKGNEKFQCFFPNTYNRIKRGSLQEWLLFPNQVWKETLVKDFEVFTVRSVASGMESQFDLSGKAVTLSSAHAIMLQNFDVIYDGKPYPISHNSMDKNAPELAVINGFSENLAEIYNALNAFRPYTSPCDSPTYDFDAFKASVDGLINFKANVDKFKTHLETYGKDLRVSAENLSEFCKQNQLEGDCSTSESAARLYLAKMKASLAERFSDSNLDKFVSDIKGIKSAVEEAEAQTTYTGMALKLLDKIEQRVDMDEVDLKRLSRGALFFANISDSNNPKEVTSILKAYTLPAVSFYSKREVGAHVHITAYLGLASGNYTSDAIKPDERTSIYAPIGLEVSRGLESGGSLSFMLSPVDFGYPVHQRLNGNENSSKLKDILAPSLTIAYGFNDLPITAGIGYQQGRHDTTINETEKRWLAFLAFDMPLWTLR
ncbi:hypothetical protein ACFL2V_02310 [Pseudomonadota bacterium]